MTGNPNHDERGKFSSGKLQRLSDLMQLHNDAEYAYKAAYKKDSLMNEGGEGYRISDNVFEKLMKIKDDIFRETWDKETFEKRRQEWNSEVKKYGDKFNFKSLQEVEKKLGYRKEDMIKAKSIHG